MTNIIEFIQDPELIGETLSPYQETALRLAYGLELTEEQRSIAFHATGRHFVAEGDLREFAEMTFVCGRRSGKSDRLAANIAVFEATTGGHESHLAPGERGHVMLIAQDKRAGRILYRYILAKLQGSALLSRYIATVRAEEIDLTNGLTLSIFPCSFRATRGFSIPVAILDELSFFRVEGVNVDKDVIDALRPAQATFPRAKLVKVTSPYMKTGETYRDFATRDKRPELLCFQAASWEMNPTIPQAFLDSEKARDPEYFDREYAALFTDQLSNAFSREAVEACIVPGRYELGYCDEFEYLCGLDPSGGGPDEFTACICHKEKNLIVQDCIRGFHSKRPADVASEIADLMRSYRVYRGTGDRYSGQWVRQEFGKLGIEYQVSDLTASEAYLELLPLVNQGSIALLDEKKQTSQLIALERRKAKSGKDSLGHPAGGHDDRANALALAAAAISVGKPPNYLIEEPLTGF